MDDYAAFEQELREALTHLYDPIYQAPELLRRTIAAHVPDETRSIQQLVLEAIQGLEPDRDVPRNARSRRLYELLAYRYVQELTQEETAARLAITPRHLRREQQQAVQMLAQALWARRPQNEYLDVTTPPAKPSQADATGWRTQVLQELAVLEQRDPGVVAEVAEVVDQVVRLELGLSGRRRCSVLPGSVPDGLRAAVHPSVLRQILIVAVQKLVGVMERGEIVLSATFGTGAVCVRVAGTPVAPNAGVSSEFIAETVAAHGGEAGVHRNEEQATFWIRLPKVTLVTVLVVEDNPDIVHFYRRYTERTRFQIVHVTEGQQAFEAVRSVRPDVVVLDVMLPDVDGWEVLTLLHEDPETRPIPVIVCSVVRQEELALALGARMYVPKPVRRQELIRALAEVVGPDPAAAPTGPANREAAC